MSSEAAPSASSSALVLFSGGQDSSVCLAWALDRYERVETVGFDYGQRHAVEMTARERVRDAIRHQTSLLTRHPMADAAVDAEAIVALLRSDPNR